VRAPDENVYVAPLNLIEIFLVALPFEWGLPKARYERLNDVVMGVVYAPLLCVSALFERRMALEINENRSRGGEDDYVAEEWDHVHRHAGLDFDGDGWAERVASVRTNLEVKPAVLEVLRLRAEVGDLRAAIADLAAAVAQGGGPAAADAAARLASPGPADGDAAEE